MIIINTKVFDGVAKEGNQFVIKSINFDFLLGEQDLSYLFEI